MQLADGVSGWRQIVMECRLLWLLDALARCWQISLAVDGHD